MRSMFTALAFSVLSLCFIQTTAFADELGPLVGTKIPHDLTSVDSHGQAQSFDSVKSEKGAVVVFFRSADWCPYCQKQLINLETIAKDVESRGYKLVGVSYDAPEKLEKFQKRRKISYTLLSDKSSVIIDAFKLRNEEYKEGHYAHGVPHPLIAIVDQDGIIRQKFYEEGYKKRPETAVILEALDTLAASGR